MKFTYQYRTSDNIAHSGVVVASSKDDAFRILKSQGLKPYGVAEAPGFLNKMLGKGKRWIAICILGAAAVFSTALALQERSRTSGGVAPRQQIYGDPGVLQECEREHWENVFSDGFDVLLAQFAQPGRKIAAPKECPTANLDSVAVSPEEPAETAKMKRIVNGMKLELKGYLAAGGSVEGYVERLVERQNVEVEIARSYEQDFNLLRQRGASAEARKSVIREWNEKNAILRDMGLRSVRMPDEWEEKSENTPLTGE